MNKFFFLGFLVTASLFGKSVGLMIMATGNYLPFAERLIQSADRYFLKGHNLTFFVFSDRLLSSYAMQDRRIVLIEQPRLGWPFDSMKRFEIYSKHSNLLSSQDYLFSIDADCLFVDFVGDEILGDLVGVRHAGFLDRRGTYESNPLSLACVYPEEGQCYFAGGFYGGSRYEMLNMCQYLALSIQEDLRNGIVALWHDESFLNRYFIDHLPTIILPVSYCIGEQDDRPFQKKIIALLKDHNKLRGSDFLENE